MRDYKILPEPHSTDKTECEWPPPVRDRMAQSPSVAATLVVELATRRRI
jgi:hypothetical protein